LKKIFGEVFGENIFTDEQIKLIKEFLYVELKENFSLLDFHGKPKTRKLFF
jgi:hypothetical protein